MSGWPANSMPNMSNTSRSSQLAVRCTGTAVAGLEAFLR